MPIAQHTPVTRYAQAQIGKPYRFGASGPRAFDCSGLVLRALATVGIEVTHNSGEQARELRAVAATSFNKPKLRPGDVVFWYGDLTPDAKGVVHYESTTHCGIYLGRSSTGLFMCVAAVDQAHGVMSHRMNWALRPSGFAFLGLQ